MIYVIASVELKQGKRNDFLDEFRDIVPLVCEEKGCLEYGPTVDVGTNISAQGDVREDIVTVVEKWESIEALEHHLIAPHMVEYRGKVKHMVVGTQLQILEPV